MNSDVGPAVSIPTVSIFTDGSCLRNPGPGGWAALLCFEAHEKMMSGSETETTNNRMELMGPIMALRALKRPCRVILSTDSQYVQKGITVWIKGWMAKGWRTKTGMVKNQDLWQMLWVETQRHQVTWEWVRGHAGHPENERVDQAARQAAVAQKGD